MNEKHSLVCYVLDKYKKKLPMVAVFYFEELVGIS